MLIRRLVDSHTDHSVPRYYRTRTVRWALAIDPAGRGQLIDRADAQHKNGNQLAAPYLTRSGKTPPPMLLVDTLEYVLGIAKDVPAKLAGDAWEHAVDKARADADRRHSAYLELLGQWAHTSGDPAAAAVCEFFTGGGCLAVLDDPRLRTAKPSDVVAILLDGEMAHMRDSAVAFWARIAQARKSSGAEGLCLSCGAAGPVLKTIPDMVKGSLIPVGVDAKGRPKRGQDAALVSVNTTAQGRQGTLQLGNTPLCEDCGGTAVAALNRLLTHPRHHRRGEDTVLTWWLREPDAEFDLRIIDNPTPDQVANLHKEVWSGRTTTRTDTPVEAEGGDAEAVEVNANDFYAITLSANKSRVVVRDWIDVPLPEIKRRVWQWFADHESTQLWADGVHQVGLYKMVQASGRWDRNRTSYVAGSAIHGLERDLLRCALHGGPPPASLAPRLLHRIRNDHHVDLPRVAMLRLALNRPPYRKEYLMPGLNESSTDPAYVWGRLFAVLEALQRKAVPGINATIRDRYFGLAMSQPAATLRTLRLNADAHVKKLTRTDATRAAGRALDNRLAAIATRLDDATSLPTHLDVPGQVLFILGYDHQRAADLAAARAAKAAKTAKATGNANPFDDSDAATAAAVAEDLLA
ncbi:type I-C CRISPR-associated protein Cas8c/Csd1 [Nocardia wallacei]|uniref:type I-C CRISPR-associated protein Cas8c/Csd1 n=1 Tax=Nocardia wallacei TaxID=480035 RepID=UPI002455DA4D|nr:type I-C CRISPR-associated protein Cas8c/Csd1 [Nocardia wallacei]